MFSLVANLLLSAGALVIISLLIGSVHDVVDLSYAKQTDDHILLIITHMALRTSLAAIIIMVISIATKIEHWKNIDNLKILRIQEYHFLNIYTKSQFPLGIHKTLLNKRLQGRTKKHAKDREVN